MARIRSIKPSFATDGDMKRLSDSCALFFILFWNHCDDEGKHRLDLEQVVAELGGRWHRGKVKLFMSCLLKSGQLRINSDSTWVQVTGWSHQRIDKPIQPDVKAADLQWLSAEDSRNALDDSRTFPTRIGEDRKDRIGEDITSAGVGKRPTPAEIVPIVPRPDRGANKRIWESYRESYLKRYQVEPVRNARVNANVSQLAARVGADDAVEIVKFYLSHNDSFYVRNTHSISLCLRDAESLRTQWLKGRAITQNDVRRFENRQQQADLLDAIEKGEV